MLSLHRDTDKLTFLDIEVYLLLTQLGSSRLVAETLKLSPTKVSRCLGALRQVFDDELFRRGALRLEMTPTAKAVYPVLSEISRAVKSVNGLNRCAVDRLILAVPPAIALGLTTRLHNTVKPVGVHQEVQLVSNSSYGLEELLSERIDVLITSRKLTHGDVEVLLVGERRQCFITAQEDHPVWHKLTQGFSTREVMASERGATLREIIQRHQLPIVDQLGHNHLDLASVITALKQHDGLLLQSFATTSELLGSVSGLRSQQLSRSETEALEVNGLPRGLYVHYKRDRMGRARAPFWLRRTLEQHVQTCLGEPTPTSVDPAIVERCRA